MTGFQSVVDDGWDCFDRGGKLPEGLLGIGETVKFVPHRFAVVAAADEVELAEIGDRHLLVLVPVADHLLAGDELREIDFEGLGFDDAPRRLLAGERII